MPRKLSVASNAERAPRPLERGCTSRSLCTCAKPPPVRQKSSPRRPPMLPSASRSSLPYSLPCGVRGSTPRIERWYPASALFAEGVARLWTPPDRSCDFSSQHGRQPRHAARSLTSPGDLTFPRHLHGTSICYPPGPEALPCNGRPLLRSLLGRGLHAPLLCNVEFWTVGSLRSKQDP